MTKFRFPALFLALALLLSAVPARALDDPGIAATAVILVDADNREVLYEYNAHEHRFPASITKVMTVLLTLEAIDRGELGLEDVITASDTYQRGLSADGSSQNIKPDEQMTVHDLLYCVLVASANEACNILAEAVAGSVDAFLDLMNARANELGMKDTNFANTHGLHNANHYTTAYDIWLMTEEAMGHRIFREIVAAVNHTVPATNLSDARLFYNTNALLTSWRYPGYTYSYATGVKTGSTPEAGQCLVSSAIRDGKTLIAVVLGAENVKLDDGSLDRQSFSESKRLLEWGFKNFSRRTILDGSKPVGELPVTLAREVAYVTVRPADTIAATLPNDLDVGSFDRDVTLFYESVEAPVTAGQVLGEITVSDGERVYGTVPLVAVSDVERSEVLYRIYQVRSLFGQRWLQITLAVIAVLILIVALRLTVFKPRRRGYGGRSRKRRR